MTAYRMISEEKAEGFPVSIARALLGVSRSGSYDWERRAPSDRQLTDAGLIEKITEIHVANRGVYGWGHPRRAASRSRRPCLRQARASADAPGRRVGAAAPRARPNDLAGARGPRR